MKKTVTVTPRKLRIIRETVLKLAVRGGRAVAPTDPIVTCSSICG